MALVQYWRQIPVSVETTYVTTLDAASGRPDYLGWMNKHARGDVLPENNAAILIAAFAGRLTTDAAKKAWLREVGAPEGKVEDERPPDVEEFVAALSQAETEEAAR